MRLPLAALLFATATLPALEFHLDGYVGQLAGDDELEPLDKRLEYGVLADARLPFMPFSIGANGFYNTKSKDDAEVTCRELQIGIVKIFDPLVLVHPFIGGGINWVDMVVEPVGTDQLDGRGVGGWINGGVHLTFALFDVGVLAGWSRALVDTGAGKVDGGGVRIGAFIGLGF